MLQHLFEVLTYTEYNHNTKKQTAMACEFVGLQTYCHSQAMVCSCLVMYCKMVRWRLPRAKSTGRFPLSSTSSKLPPCNTDNNKLVYSIRIHNNPSNIHDFGKKNCTTKILFFIQIRDSFIFVTSQVPYIFYQKFEAVEIPSDA